MENCGPLLADIDERSLNARDNRCYPAEIDVADGPPAVLTLYQQLYEILVFEYRNPDLALCVIYDNFLLNSQYSNPSKRVTIPIRADSRNPLLFHIKSPYA